MAADTPIPGERRARRGMVVVLVAMTVFITFGFAALSADVGHLYAVSVELKMVADSSALAGAIGLKTSPTQARKLAAAYADLHFVDGRQVALKDTDIRLGTWDFATRTFTDLTGTTSESLATAVKVSIPRTEARGDPVAMLFAPIFGYYDANVSSSSVSALTTGKAWDLIIVQDITGSFTAELPYAKTADHVLLDCVADNTSSSSQMGLVTFTGVAQKMQDVKPLSSSYSAMDSAITSLQVCNSPGMPPCSGTDQAPGINLATTMLNGVKNVGPDVGMGMILVSDGAPNPGGGSTETVAQLQADTTAAADNAWSYGYSIWTVFYDSSNSATAQAFMSSLPRGQGSYLMTPDASQLPSMLQQICEDAIIPSLVD